MSDRSEDIAAAVIIVAMLFAPILALAVFAWVMVSILSQTIGVVLGGVALFGAGYATGRWWPTSFK